MYRTPAAAATPACERRRSAPNFVNWTGDGYRVLSAKNFGRVAIAFVQAGTVRSRADAEAFAERIARDPDSYLAVASDFHVPGIGDLRASREGTVAHAG